MVQIAGFQIANRVLAVRIGQGSAGQYEVPSRLQIDIHLTVAVGAGEINFSVAVKIGKKQVGRRLCGQCDRSRRLKGAVAIAQQGAHQAGSLRVHRQQIQLAIAIQIGQYAALKSDLRNLITMPLGEGAIAFAQPHVDGGWHFKRVDLDHIVLAIPIHVAHQNRVLAEDRGQHGRLEGAVAVAQNRGNRNHIAAAIVRSCHIAGTARVASHRVRETTHIVYAPG